MSKALKLLERHVLSVPKTVALTDWRSLNEKVILNNNVVLTGYGDVHPDRFGPVFMCKKLWMFHCNKNFVYYWLDRSTFPNLQTVYLNSHPCEESVLHRGFPKMYLHERFESYKRRWAADRSDVELISETEYQKTLQKLVSEEMRAGFHWNPNNAGVDIY
jgi:hypothetical protein